MNDRMILTPYTLDEYDPALAGMAGDDWTVVEVELPPREGEPSPSEMMSRMSIYHRQLADEVRAAIRNDERPVAILGDCCATLGVLAGLQQRGLEPTLVWLDAHGDFNTYATTPSGYLGGMPLAMAVGLGDQSLVRGVTLRPWSASKVVLADARDLDPGEADSVERSDVIHLTDIDQLLDPANIPDGPLYVHFDPDVIDPAEAPAASYPAPGGPSAEQVRGVLRALAATGRVMAVSMTAWNHDLDTDGVTRGVVQGGLNALLGR